MAIEQLQTGDYVLSADLDTGRVQPVVVQRLTTRMADSIYELKVGSDTLLSSAGHPFWDVRKGWVRTKHLNEGKELKTLQGVESIVSTRVVTDDEAEPQQVYNLVVDQTHTYFVGESMTLVHDDTMPVPRDADSLKHFTPVSVATNQ